MTDIKKMQVGQIVDFVVAFNDRQKRSEKAQEAEEKKQRKRKATQGDIDSFFG